jgi:hypothetical protein
MIGSHSSQIEVQRRHRHLLRAPRGQRARAGDHERKSGRGAQGFLARGQRDVDAPRLLAQLLAADGADTVDYGQRAVLARDPRDLLDRRAHAGGGIHVGDRDQLRRRTRQRALERAEIRHITERRAHLLDARALALEDRAHAVAEIAGVDHHRALAGIDQVRGRNLHRQRAAARDHERLRAGCQKDLARAAERAPERLRERAVHVPALRLRQRAQHVGIELDGPRDHQYGAISHAPEDTSIWGLPSAGDA